MNVKKINKIFCIILMTITAIILLLTTLTYAADKDDKFNPGKLEEGNISTTQITTIGGQVVTIVSVVGSVVSVIILVVLGLKYMMGSAEEKAEYKKTLMPYVIGAILVFAASALAGMIFEFASGIKGTT